MNCLDAENRMILYLDGNLSESEKVKFLNHISSCKHCELQLQEVKNVYSEIEAERNSFSPNLLLAQQLVAKTMKPATAYQNTFKRYVLAPLVTVAALFVGFLLGTFYLNISQLNTSMPSDELVEGFSDQYFDVLDNNPYLYQLENQDIK